MKIVFSILPLLILIGCSTTSTVVTGVARDPIDPSRVVLYSKPPAVFEEIAVIDANSKGTMTLTAQAKTDAAITRLKEEAAKLGANGVILDGITDGYGGSISIGLGTGSYSHSSGTSVGAGTSTASTYKIASGMAVFVTETHDPAED